MVFDEVHHVLKDHPYRIIAHGIQKWENDRSQRIQVIGLSASLTYAVEHKAVEQALSNLCHDLSVTKMISPSDEELIKSGYIPQDDNIEPRKLPRKYHSECWRYNLAIVLLEMLIETPYTASEER